MTKKSKQEERHKVYLTYKTSESGGGYESGESGPYGRRKDSYKTFQLDGAYRTEREFWQETVEVDFDPKDVEEIYVVVVRYSTGDSFSTTHGEWYIEGAYGNFEKADSIAKSIAKKTYKPEQEYLPWTGYFEHLESVEVVPMRLDISSCYTPDPF